MKYGNSILRDVADENKRHHSLMTSTKDTQDRLPNFPTNYYVETVVDDTNERIVTRIEVYNNEVRILIWTPASEEPTIITVGTLDEVKALQEKTRQEAKNAT